MACAFHLASSTSLHGSEPMTKPPPACTIAFHRLSSNFASSVRIKMFHCDCPVLGSMCPIEPVHARRGVASNSSMAAIVALFGQPVMLPPGNTDCNASKPSISGEIFPSTSLTICCTWGYDSIRHRFQCTLPGKQIRPKSLRSRSTSIKCSDISLRLPTSSPRRLASCSKSSPRGRVPFIGRVDTIGPSCLRSNSGLLLAIAICKSGEESQADRGAGLSLSSLSKICQGLSIS